MSYAATWPLQPDDEPWDPTFEPQDAELEVIEHAQDLWYLLKPEPWMKDAACKGKAHLFFLRPGKNSRAAKAICDTCPVFDPCRAYAAETNSEGIWAGEVRTPANASPVQDARPQIISISPRTTKDASEYPGFGTIAARRQTGT